MKIYWSAFLSLLILLALAGCGKEQFGTTPQSQSSNPDAVVAFQQASCSNHTLVKPEVDILYVVDNSTSSYYLASDIKTAIQNTIGSISGQFDYRVIGTPLLETQNGNEDYQVLAKTPETLPAGTQNKKVSAPSEFTFFSNLVTGSSEPGLERVRSFISSHQSDGLFRQGAYLFVVLVSNGRDTDIETASCVGCATIQDQAVYNARKTSLLTLKNYLHSQQFRLFSLVAHPGCTKSGWKISEKSYMQMSKDLYNLAPFPTDQSGRTYPDSYNLCAGSIGDVFTSVNNSIKQIIIPHTYKYWPITFADPATGLNTNDIKVYKSSPSSAPVLLPASNWSYISNSSLTTYNTRILPTVGEPTNSRHLIQFTSGNEITYPDCIQITSTSNLEYFGYVVLNKVPKLESVELKINGKAVSQSSSNGWSYIGQQTRNIKVQHNGFGDTPEVIRSGYMLQLNGSANYYKSGDSVEIYYVPQTN